MNIKLVVLRIVFLLLFIFVLISALFSEKVFSQDQKHAPAVSELPAESWDYQIVTLPVVVGIFHGFDLESGKLSVALNKEHTRLETIELKKIRAVYLLQGNREKLHNYLLGVAGGGALGVSGFWVKGKIYPESNPGLKNQPAYDYKEAALWTSVGAAVGVVMAWWQNRGVEDVRPWPVYSLDIYQSDPGISGKINFKDPHNLEKITAGSFVQVMINGPE